uniref:Ring finger protein 150b n=1 Tax=Sinocyclocheilus rhinocerous TaxID=307959 RepID=A0A673KXQ5_9TELE
CHSSRRPKISDTMALSLRVCSRFYRTNAPLEWYTAFVNITYVDPVTAEVRTEKTECGRYGEHSLKREARGVLAMPAAPQDRHACDPNSRFTPRGYGAWIALISRGNCTYRDKIRNAVGKNASAVVIFNVGSSNPNETITMSDPGDALDQCIMCGYDR